MIMVAKAFHSDLIATSHLKAHLGFNNWIPSKSRR
jgi:hypothetical protein